MNISGIGSASRQIKLHTAVAIVIANMVGTGVFTSLGFQLVDIHSLAAILALWAVGGVIALIGALVYAELGAAIPVSGGEYALLSRIYHPSLGFVSGWVSATVGFAAPTALAAMALEQYLRPFFSLPQGVVGLTVVALVTLVHSFRVRDGARFQSVATGIKVIFILFFVAAGLTHGEPALLRAMPAFSWGDLFSAPFAVSLIYVSYAYSGWNAAVYVAGETEDPHRNLPLALIGGTALVTVLYLGLNFVFLYTVPAGELAGKIEIGALSAVKIFGPRLGAMADFAIALLLVSTISSMTLAGPRVLHSMGHDSLRLAAFRRTTGGGAPVTAIAFQFVITTVLMLTGSFERVLIYLGFSLNLFTMATVAGVYVLRMREPGLVRPYRTWGYPVTPLIFLVTNLWITWHMANEHTLETLVGLGTVAAGFAAWWILKSKDRYAAPQPLP
jgi:APA family basic amino acid/polyamine antiporter